MLGFLRSRSGGIALAVICAVSLVWFFAAGRSRGQGLLEPELHRRQFELIESEFSQAQMDEDARLQAVLALVDLDNRLSAMPRPNARLRNATRELDDISRRAFSAERTDTNMARIFNEYVSWRDRNFRHADYFRTSLVTAAAATTSAKSTSAVSPEMLQAYDRVIANLRMTLARSQGFQAQLPSYNEGISNQEVDAVWKQRNPEWESALKELNPETPPKPGPGVPYPVRQAYECVQRVQYYSRHLLSPYRVERERREKDFEGGIEKCVDLVNALRTPS